MKRLINWITFHGFRARRRRRRYEELRALIMENHLGGKGGMIVPKKYDAKDMKCFGPPMYFFARTKENEPCIFWRKDLMIEEVNSATKKPTADEAKAEINANLTALRP